MNDKRKIPNTMLYALFNLLILGMPKDYWEYMINQILRCRNAIINLKETSGRKLWPKITLSPNLFKRSKIKKKK